MSKFLTGRIILRHSVAIAKSYWDGGIRTHTVNATADLCRFSWESEWIPQFNGNQRIPLEGGTL